MRSGTRRLALPAVLALALSAAVLTAPTAAAADRTATLVGDMQSELGCAADWSPGCAATDLVLDATSGLYTAEFTVPAGTYLYKVAIDHSWDEAYGLEGSGAPDAANIPLHLAGDATLRFSYDDTTHRVAIEVVGLGADATPSSDAALIAAPVREAGDGQNFYFVMTDRFANGDTTNDTGGIAGDRLATGFDPTDKGFYQGGDLAGLLDNLDYIEGLGTTAIWLTPSFTNRPVQGTDANASAGYHGYWITDFTQIDPHLGTNAELEDLIDEAHDRGIKVYFDIITNHTADVIDYEEGVYTYRPLSESPYTPVVTDPDAKTPAWLNDPTVYHNRGNSTWEGESVTYGDFDGLDDLATEDPRVVDGFIDVYNAWVDLGIDGFRIDTVKHVNFEFWEAWTRAVIDHAHSIGNDDFFMFGEVYDADPKKTSPYVRDTDMSSTLDFTFQANAIGYASGSSNAKTLQRLYEGDDYYTTPHSSATALPTFLGNHDMGRVGYFLRSTDDPLARDVLAHELMYLGRGQPVVYYGDEQGFVGTGGDKDARQTLFATDVDEYANQNLITGEQLGSVDRYDTDAPLYTAIAELAALREAHPALVDGAQIERYADGPVYAFSRVDRDARTEYLVATNNSASAQTVELTTLARGADFEVIYGDGTAFSSAADGQATITIPARSAVVWVTDAEVSAPASVSDIAFASPTPGAAVSGVSPIEVQVDDTWRETSFAWRLVGDDTWTPLGTAEDTTPRVFHDVSDLPTGTLVEYRAVSVDADGRLSAASSLGSVGNAVDGLLPSTGDGDIESVTVAGTFNSEIGCAGDWVPACDAAMMTQRADGTWTGTWDLPAGDHQYKIAINGDWTVNYGVGGVFDAGNVSFSLDDPATVTFYFDPTSHRFTSTAEGPIVSFAGTFQNELGCTGEWDPTCLLVWPFDDDRDGVYEYTTTALPAGGYEGKLVHDLSWDESYGTSTGGNVAFTVAEGDEIRFCYVLATHTVQIGTEACPTGEPPAPPVFTQPGAVSVPGELNSEMGCDADWNPACDAAQLTLRADGTWRGTWVLPAGTYQYKIAIDRRWNESYGDPAGPGGNAQLAVPTEGPVTFSYDHRTHVFSAVLGDDPGEEPGVGGISASSTKLVAGGAVTVTGTGFDALETVQLWIESTPVLLAARTAAIDGTVSFTVTIPASTPAGAHHLRLVGTGSGVQALLAVNVAAGPGLAATGATGLDVSAPIALGMLLLGMLLLGMLLLRPAVAVRRRRRVSSSA